MENASWSASEGVDALRSISSLRSMPRAAGRALSLSATRFVERVFDAPVAVVRHFGLDDGVFSRKNDGIVEDYVPHDARNAPGNFALERRAISM